MTPNDLRIAQALDAFREISRALSLASVPEWFELDLSMPQLKTLFVLSCENAATVGQVGEVLGVGLSTASHLIDRLVTAGLATRSEDPADRRRTLVRLSPQGDELTRRLRQGSQTQLRDWLSRIDDADLEALVAGLQALVAVGASAETRSSFGPARR